jgi:hypothetical protein
VAQYNTKNSLPVESMEGMADALLRPKTKKSCAGKRRGPRRAITEEQVLLLIADREAGAPLRVLAARYGVSVSHCHHLCKVVRIKRGTTP